MKPSITWDEERTRQLEEMRAEGYSFSQIAARLGMTKNAIQKKNRRMTNPGSQPKPPRRDGCELREVQHVPNEPEPLNIATIALREHHCRWVVSIGPALFCGHQKTKGSYCAHHAERAYQTPKDRKTKAQPLTFRSFK